MDGIVRSWRLQAHAVVFLTWLLLAAPAAPASAQPAPPTPVLTAHDLPAGYRAADPAQLPAGTTYLAAVTCTEDDGGYAGVDTRLAGWQGDGSAVFELVARPVSEEAAASLEGHLVACGDTQQPFAVPGVAGAAGWHATYTDARGIFDEHVISFRRGDLVEVLTTVQPQPASAQLATALAVVASGRLPAGSSEAEPPLDTAGRLGSVLGGLLALLVLYPELLDWFGDRRRRRGARTLARQPAPRPHPALVTDVSARARRLHRAALGVFLVELAALCCLTYGGVCLAASRTSAGVILLAVAAALGAAALLLRSRRRPHIGGIPGRRRPSSVLLAAAAVLLGLLGVFIVVLGALGASAQSDIALSSGSDTNFTSVSWFGVAVLAGAVALHRLSLRVALAAPAPAAPSDAAPPVLYLRSFADDHLRLRVAPFARRSLLERLSSRRKQTFEEVIAEELQQRAPVIAVGEPGRHLPPLGFSRRTLSDDEWQTAIQQWMKAASAVVLIAGRSAGLAWEVDAILRSGAWRKALILFPPVSGDEQIRRWTTLERLLAASDVPGLGVPPPPAVLLAVTFDPDGSVRYCVAKRANAWSYKAALDEALRCLLAANAAGAVPAVRAPRPGNAVADPTS